MNARVLIVEDDRAIADIIFLYLTKDGIAAERRESAEDALDFFHREGADLVVLDLNLPGMDGFEFLGELRKTSTVPVIIVSAREADEDKVLGLGLGADDFVTKPFSPRVLAARVRAQLRRSLYAGAAGVGPDGAAAQSIAFGPFVLLIDERRLERDGRRVPLSRKEFELLSFLASHRRAAFTPEELYREVWGSDYGDLSTVAGHVRRLRLKLEEDPSSPLWIRTVHGFGYSFDPPEDGAPEDGDEA